MKKSNLAGCLAACLLLAACGNPSQQKATENQNESMSSTSSYQRVDWRHHTNVYEVNVRQYTREGTFNAFRKELPRLKTMGVHTLWFMPITPISQAKKKGTLGSYYAAHDYTSINPEFGTLEDFRELVKDAHAQGFKVIIDWVANHTGWDHVWTKTHPDYFKKNENGEFFDKNGWDDVIDLDFDNPAMRRAMLDAMKFWITECDIDGFRADMCMLVPLDFWREARKELDAVKPLFWLGEVDQADNPDYLEVFDAAYTWRWMHKAKEFYQTHRQVASLDSILHLYDTLPQQHAIRAWFTTNHDENSWNGTEYEKYGDMAKTLAVFSCTYNGIPLLYSGQEKPNLKRLKFFDKDPIEWNGQYELGGFYQKLLELHSNHPAVAGGDTTIITRRVNPVNDKTALSYVRSKGDREIFVVLNCSPYPANYKFGEFRLKGSFSELFTGDVKDWKEEVAVSLPAWGYAVYVK